MKLCIVKLFNIFKCLKQIQFLFFCSVFFISCLNTNAPEVIQENSPSLDLNPEDRFIVYETGLVFDKITGLEWYAGDVTRLEEQGTRFWLRKLNNRDPGWQLPTRDELYTLNKSARKYCKSLRLTRDVFWIRNFRAYDLISNIDVSPRMLRHRHGFFFSRHSNDDHDYEIRAFIIVVRPKKQSNKES